MRQECQLRVQLFSKIPHILPLYLKAWFQEFIIQNASNMAAVAVASQSAPPETAGPVLGINDLYRINLDVPGPSVHCLR